MAIKSILKPEGSVLMGGVTVIMVIALYGKSLPSGAVMQATRANDQNIEAARKKATWTSVGLVSIISLLTRDANIFILGGLTTVALDFHARHANASAPDTGMLVSEATPSRGLSVVPAAGY